MSLKNLDEGGARVFMTIPLDILGSGPLDKEGRFPTFGNVLGGFNAVLKRPSLRDKSFTSKEFNSFRKNKNRKLFSYRTIKSELDGMVALGILKAEDPAERFEPIKYTLTERYQRAGKALPAIRKLLKLLPARPGKEELERTREKLDNQVFAEGEDLAYYYLRAIPNLNLRLIRLAAERSTLEKELKKDPDNADKKEQLNSCLARINALKTELELESELLSPPDYPLERTEGRDYRSEARENIRRAITFIEAKNESAASTLLSAAKRRFAEELHQLYKTEVRILGPRVWPDVEAKIHNVLRGQYKVHEISGDRQVPVKEKVPHRSSTEWQAIRACDKEIGNMLKELDWIRERGAPLSSLIDILQTRKRGLPGSKKREPLPQPELSDDEVSAIKELLTEIKEEMDGKTVAEKVIAFTAASSALELLELGQYRGMLEEMMSVRSLLRKRYHSVAGMIDKIKTGRLTLLRENIRVRNSWNISKLDQILAMFNSGKKDKAHRWWLGIARDRNVRSEPEFSRMHAVLGQVKDMFLEDGKEGTVRRNIGIMKERVRLAELLNSFMEDLRDAYVDARLEGAPVGVYDSIFAEKFNQYLDFAKKNNIGRGSPRLLWTFFFLAAYVSMNMPDPQKPSKKIKNPLFPAMLDLVRMLEVNDIPILAKAFERKTKKYANLSGMLKEFERAGHVKLDDLGTAEWFRLLKALSM
ncbi:hypothetical protein ACFL5E_03930, partial [Candidatus Omnitrophota bacterium]